jgi:hypothetical protein
VEKGYKVLEGNSTGRFGSSRIISRAFYLRSFTGFQDSRSRHSSTISLESSKPNHSASSFESIVNDRISNRVTSIIDPRRPWLIHVPARI